MFVSTAAAMTMQPLIKKEPLGEDLTYTTTSMYIGKLLAACQLLYCIVGTWRGFKCGNLVNWVKIAKLKTCLFKLNACAPMTLSIQIAKFKFRQYQLKAVSPNLMLAKVTRYLAFYTS